MQAEKNIQMPTWLARTLLVGLGAIFVLLPFHAFISTWGGAELGPLWLWKSWKELLLGMLALLTLGWLALRPSALRLLSVKPLVWLIVVYLLLSIIMAALYWRENGSEASFAGLAMNLRYLAAGALAYLLALFGGYSPRISLLAERTLIGLGVFVAVLGIVQVLLLPADFLTRFGYEKGVTIAPATLIDNNPDALRAFATLRGPNDFGAFLILPLLLVIVRFRSLPRWAGIAALVALTWALVLSSSRSAWLGALAALLVYVGLTSGIRMTKKRVVLGSAALLMAGMAAFYAAITVPVIRMAVFHSSPGDPSLTEGSTDNHIQATVGGVERAVENPLGCAPGCAGPASYYGDDPRISENYFVQIAEEVGVVGVSLFLGIVGVVAVALYRAQSFRREAVALLAALAGYIVIGVLLHVWSDDPLSITWWLLAGAVIGYNERQQWNKSKGSSRSKTSSSS